MAQYYNIRSENATTNGTTNAHQSNTAIMNSGGFKQSFTNGMYFHFICTDIPTQNAITKDI